MPRIVGIHGIGNQYGGAATLRSVWLPAIQDGLAAAGHRYLAGDLTVGDLSVAFFGDLFRPPGSLALSAIPYTADDLTSPGEIDLVTDLYRAAVEQEPSLAPAEATLGPLGVAVQVMIERLLRSLTFAKIPKHLFIGNLKQVTRFLSEPDIKSRVFARVRAEIDDQTRVFIGHSLGSVVAYEYLCRHPGPEPAVLITLGSPLGIRTAIFDALTPPPSKAGAGAWPAATRWTNIADRDDIVALRKDLAPLFPPPLCVPPVFDQLVDNGGEPHSAERYLTTSQAGAAVAAGL